MLDKILIVLNTCLQFAVVFALASRPTGQSYGSMRVGSSARAEGNPQKVESSRNLPLVTGYRG